MNRKLFALIILFVGICISTVVGIFLSDRNVKFVAVDNNNLGISIKLNSYEWTIKPYYNNKDKKYYFFLPSALCNNKIYNDSKNVKIDIDGKEINRFGCFEWTDGTVYAISYGKSTVNAVFMKSSEIATLFISTESGSTKELDADKTHSELGKIDVIEPDGTISYSGRFLIKGRGNSTFHFKKKPYNIKLNHPARILGMTMDKDFCLLANSWDYSYMNNKLAFDMAKKAGFDYVPDAEYADVYFNGEYWGIYLLAEKTEIGKHRIDIADLKAENEKVNPGVDFAAVEKFDYGNKRGIYLKNIPSDITGGYLIERDNRLRPDYPSRVITTSYFETEDYGTCFNIKCPKFASAEEVDYISGITSEMEQAIRSVDGYSEYGKYYLDYIDLNSWAKWYIIAEIAYDLDKDGTNTYYYKDRDSTDSKFYCGPVWDYDCRFGGTVQYSHPDLVVRLSKEEKENVFLYGWDQYLYEKDEFLEEVHRDWKFFFNEYLRVDAQRNINNWQELIRNSVSMDNVRWDRSAGYGVRWPGKDNSENFISIYIFDDQVRHLQNWIEARRVFLDSLWGE